MEWGSLSASKNAVSKFYTIPSRLFFSFLVSRPVLFVGLFPGELRLCRKKFFGRQYTLFRPAFFAAIWFGGEVLGRWGQLLSWPRILHEIS